MNANFAVHPLRRLAYSFIGLIAGDVILLLFLLHNAIRSRALLLASHVGQPAVQIPLAFKMFAIYGTFSLAGWMLVGLPTAVLFPAHYVLRLRWALRAMIGAALGPFALVAILVLVNRGRVSFPASFAHMGVLWVLAMLVSAVSLAVYAALLGKAKATGVTRRNVKESG
jgi:hypothetical protein